MTTDLLVTARPITQAAAPSAPGSTSADARPTGHPRLPWFGLACLTLLGTAIRFGGLTSLGLWRDDAWAALSTRVGIGTAWHMWATAPGFYALERGWILLGPAATWWDQLVPLAAGIAAIPAAYLLARYFGFGPKLCLGVALVVSVSPTCAMYSSRVKEYSTDFLVSCLLLAVAEAARRKPERRRYAVLALVSVTCFAVSASSLPVVVGVWAALGVCAASDRPMRRRFVAAGTAMTASCAVVAGVFYRHISPALHRFWASNYVSHRSPAAFASSVHTLLLSLYSAMFGISVSRPAESLAVFVTVSGLLVLGVSFGRGRALMAPALVLGAAGAACVLGAIPLGTGRTDEALYPAILLLLAAGLRRARRTISGWPAPSAPGRMTAVALSVVVVGALLVVGVTDNVAYPATDTRGLAAQVDAAVRPGDGIVVNELMRYPWALYEEPRLRLEFGPQWSTDFSVISTQPGVFIAPSEYYEGGSHPAAWAARMAGFTRLWFVETQPLRWSPLYRALRAAGWRTVRTLHATGCAAMLMERTGVAAT